MGKSAQVVSVCKNCGAVGQATAQHCVFCGAGISSDMLLHKKKPIEKVVNRGGQGTANPEKKKLSLSGMASLLCGVLAVITFAAKIFSGGILTGVIAIVLGVASLTKRSYKAIPAAIGLGLGIYVVFVNLVWLFHPLLFLF